METFNFEPPRRGPYASQRDAGLPAHGYAPPQGKLTQVTNENTGKVCNQTIVSIASPDFFKAPFDSNREFFKAAGKTQDLRATTGVSLAAGQVDGNDQFLKQKRHDIKCESTHRVHNQSVVSKGSPEWFKTAFKSNSEYFNNMGIVQKVRTAGEAQRYQYQAGLHGVPTYPKEKGSTKMGMVHPVTGRCYNRSIVSVGVPDWMKRPYESNREYFDTIGMTQSLVNPPDKEDGNFVLGKRRQYVNSETGKVSNVQILSPKTPDWMKQSFENNRAYFEKNGLVEQLRKPDLQNLRYRPERRNKEVWELSKVQTSRANKVSEEAPEWMVPAASARASQCSRVESEASTNSHRVKPGKVRGMVSSLESKLSQKNETTGKKTKTAAVEGTSSRKRR